MPKSVSLAVLGISIVVAGVSLGFALTRYLGLLAYSPRGTARTTTAPAGRDAPATPPEEWNNPFAPADGMRMASRLAASSAKGAAQAPRTRFVLVGTIVSSTPSARRAILWADGMKTPKAYREREEIEPGAVLAAVQRDKVWIAHGKEREKLEIVPVGSRARAAATGAPALSPGALPQPATLALPPSHPGEEEEEENISPRRRRRQARGLRR